MIISKIKYTPEFFDLVVKMQLREQMLVNGYYIVENIVSIEKIDALMETIFKIFLKYCPSNKFQDYQKPWETDLFHDEMINFRKLEPKKFSLLYDTVQTSFSVYQLVHSNLIGENCANLLGVKETELSVTEGMVRMDVPHDKRNIAGWHQEISYLRNEGLVVWIPLTDITIKLGLLEICPKSHLEGELKIEKISDVPSDVSTVSFDEVPTENIEKYPVMPIEIKKGSALMFDVHLFHRSGTNSSNMCRFSCQTRYSVANSMDFVPFRQSKVYSKIGLKMAGRDKSCFSTY